MNQYEQELIALRQVCLEMMSYDPGEEVMAILQDIYDWVYTELDRLPMIDTRIEQYWADLERAWKRSTTKLTPAEEIDAFSAEGVVKHNYLMATRSGKSPDWLYQLHLAAQGITSSFVTAEQIARAKTYPLAELLREHGYRVIHNSASCPFHLEKNASLHIYPTNTYHCFGCQANGDAISLYQHLNKCNFNTAVNDLYGKA